MGEKIIEGRMDFMDDKGNIVLRPVGVVHSPLTMESNDSPFQSFTSDIEGSVEVFKEYERGLDGIEKFSHITLIYYMHKSDRTKLYTVPLMEDEERGIFGTRSPSRPNHIGISTVRLLQRRSRFLDVKGIDIFDGTPVIDIKPYVPKVDLVRGVDNEWLSRKLDRLQKDGKLDDL